MKRLLLLTALLFSFLAPLAQTEAESQLIRASLTNDMGAAMEALGAGANINVQDAMGRTPIMLAAKLGHTPLVIVYIDRGAKVNAKDNEGATPLMFACRNDRYDAAMVLLDKEADKEATDQQGMTALMTAAELGHHEIMGLLLERGAIPKFTKDEELEATNTGDMGKDLNATLLNAILNHDEASAKQALQAGAEPDARSKRKIPALIMAASRKQEGIVEALLNHNADVNVRATDKSKGIGQITPLHVAAANGHVGILRLLLTSGAMVNAQEHFGLTPLMSAAELGNTVNIILLLDHGAEVNVQDYEGNSALMFAVIKNNLDGARILLDKGADADLADEQMTTPLMVAAQNGNADMVELLLKNGANPKLRRGANGYRAADFAKLNGFRDVAKMIRAAD